jgi:hypothetical protein
VRALIAGISVGENKGRGGNISNQFTMILLTAIESEFNGLPISKVKCEFAETPFNFKDIAVF